MELQGLHHLALFTLDMDQTVRFWTNVLKARLVRAAQDQEPGLRHYYFEVGGSLVAFFEFPVKDKESFQFGWMHHLALRAKSIEDLEEWRKHIETFEVPVSEVRNHDYVKSIYLHDPNGILIEISATGREFTPDDLKQDPKPVLALKEILKKLE